MKHLFARGALALVMALGINLLAVCGSYAADTYPSRPVSLLVGFAPGGGTDQMARIYARKLSEKFNNQFMVINREGAGGNIAIQALAHYPADGYTLALGSDYIATNVALKRNPYNWDRDLQPVATIAQLPNVLIVPANSPFNSLADVIAAAKRPGTQLTYSSAGVGTSQHLCGEMFNVMAGTHLTHVPYRGAALAESALLGGQVDMMFDSVATAVVLAKGGKVKILAITSQHRQPYLPDTPTMEEGGLKGFEVSPAYYFLAPAKTPKPIIDKLANAIRETSKAPEVRKFMGTLNAIIVNDGPQETKAHMKSQVETWQHIVAVSGLKVE